MGKENWEEAEKCHAGKGGQDGYGKGLSYRRKINYCFAGDLLGQLIATSFGTEAWKIPLLGLYGACATMGEALGLGAMTVNAGYGEMYLHGFQSFCYSRKRVPFSSCLWKPETKIRHLDGNRLWGSSGWKNMEKKESPGSQASPQAR